MRHTILGFFSDYELAEFARTQVMMSGVPVSRITLTAMQGAGQSRFHATAIACDKFLTSLRTMIQRGRVHGHPERIAARVERGIATVLAHTKNPAEAQRVTSILRNCGAVDTAQDTSDDLPVAEVTADHEGAWPTHLWPAG